MGVDGSVFRAYLDVQARFDLYSVSNAILIAAQCPEATKLADFDTWKADGVYVKRGQDAISILEPGKEYTRQKDGSTGVFCNVKKVNPFLRIALPQICLHGSVDGLLRIDGLLDTLTAYLGQPELQGFSLGEGMDWMMRRTCSNRTLQQEDG